jgi:AraC family transcriptional regulator of adaptative response / DNA-3-methyladenine glycosylase II
MKKIDIFYKAMLARDYRFDGKFFVGVKTTGVYCRPICPAKPKKENVEFFATALESEKAGYRPCLRCRPESAPLSSIWQGKSASVQKALKMMSLPTFAEDNLNNIANQLGITGRHLRRLFEEEIGYSPKQVIINNKLNFAKKLITETNIPITTIALTSAFSSLRRFNDAFKKRFHKPPSSFRKTHSLEHGEEGINLSLSFRPPFAWETLLNFYRSHQILGIDKVDESSYERVFKLDNILGAFRITLKPDKAKINLCVHVDDPTILFKVTQKVRQMFDLDSDPLLVANTFQEAHPFLEKLWLKYPGLRIPQGWEPFETAICTILGQLVSMQHARMLATQLVQTYGEEVIHPFSKEKAFIFPTPEVLANADLQCIKTTQARKKTIRKLASLVVENEIDFYSAQDPDLLRKQLLEIPGIGPWSADYISLRALGNTDAFPHTDLILKRALAQHSDLPLAKVRPWRSYLAIYLWNEYAKTLSKLSGDKK